MKFSCTADIKAPINKVVALFDNTDNLKHWQDGFLGHEHLSGVPGSAGARSKLRYRSGKHLLELTETIHIKQLPSEMKALYEDKHMVNTMTTRFTELPGQNTRYTVEIEYIKFKGFMPRLMAVLMPGLFKKQVQKWTDQFKAFVEQETGK